MEGVPALRDIVEPNDFLTKIDLKDAYIVVPIHPGSRKFLSFSHKGTIYQYKSLAFGLSVAPRIFSKLMRYALEPLRARGIRLVYYLDDICVLAKTKEEIQVHSQMVLQQLTNLGFLINYEKSDLEPKHTQEFLGFNFNTKTMKISVPQIKLSKLITRIRQLLKKTTTYSCRWIASLLGKMTSMIPAIGEALLHVRYIQRDLAVALRQQHQNWEKPCQLSAMSWKELNWWLAQAPLLNGLPIIMKKEEKTPDIEIYVDASDTGWGVTSAKIETAGYWSPEERELSINVRELKTILFALQLHAKEFGDSLIKVYSDNITALKYAKKSGGTASQYLQELALAIYELTARHNIQVQYQHVQGVKNVRADFLSRRKKPLYEWKLPRRFFKMIQAQWGPLKLDAFATRENTRLPRFWSLQPDPQAEALDAFKQKWIKTGMYLHPPWKLIPKVIRKIQEDQVKSAVLVTPNWPSQFWWPLVLHRSQAAPLTFQLNKQWSLTAWLLSGRTK